MYVHLFRKEAQGRVRIYEVENAYIDQHLEKIITWKCNSPDFVKRWKPWSYSNRVEVKVLTQALGALSSGLVSARWIMGREIESGIIETKKKHCWLLCMCYWINWMGCGATKTRHSSGPRTDVMILKIFSPKNLAKIFAFFAQTTVSFCKNCYHNIGFWEKRHFFRRKLAKIAENCDHNIDP
jgi:hypothetical protein